MSGFYGGTNEMEMWLCLRVGFGLHYQQVGSEFSSEFTSDTFMYNREGVQGHR